MSYNDDNNIISVENPNEKINIRSLLDTTADSIHYLRIAKISKDELTAALKDLSTVETAVIE